MPDLRFLSKKEIEDIHTASLDVLEKTGVLVKNYEALELLEKAGCIVDSQVVRIPQDLVEDCLKRPPSSLKLWTREGDRSLSVGNDNVIYNPGSAAINFIDRNTWEMRRAVSQDLVQLVRLVDALKYIQAQSTAIVPSDIPEEISDLYRLYVILKNSSKPIVTGAFTKEGLMDMKRMLEAVVGGSETLTSAPRAIFDCCPSSPLMWSDVTCQNLMDCADHGIPAEIVPAPQIGATSPITVAGTLVQSNAEILSGVVISQTVKSGAPLIYGGSLSSFDMRYCTARLSAIEAMITACAAAEIGKHYGMPTHAYLGLSDSKTVDPQSGFESGLGISLAALSHINIVSGPGMLACENCQSLEKLVIDNEICGTAYRLIEGFSTDISVLAIDVIEKVGPGGHYLAEKHTRENLRKEHFIPSDIICRMTPDSWRKSGSKNALNRAKELTDRLLREHVPTPLPKEADDYLEKVFKDILARYEIPLSKLPSLE